MNAHKQVEYDLVDGIMVPKAKRVDKDAPIRSVTKAITWRIVGTIDTTMLGWLVSGDFRIGLTIGGFEIVTKMVLYYFHERAWTNINWGKHWRKNGLVRRIKLSYILRKRRKEQNLRE